jgi:hypothetical protein
MRHECDRLHFFIHKTPKCHQSCIAKEKKEKQYKNADPKQQSKSKKGKKKEIRNWAPLTGVWKGGSGLPSVMRAASLSCW